MTVTGQPDCFHVVNGPEDGMRFPIVRAPLHIGSDPTCPVHLSLDRDVRGHHALVTVVSEGYRVRRVGAAPVYVDGKRAGMVRSRIVRQGGLVKVGNTLLCLECAPAGIAKRSRGLVTESDLGWAAAESVRGAWRMLRGLVGFLLRVFGRLATSWMAVLAIVFLVFYLSSSLRAWAWYYVQLALYWVRTQLSQF